MNNGFQGSLVPTCGVETVKNAETISVSVNWGYVRHIFIFLLIQPKMELQIRMLMTITNNNTNNH